MFVAVFFYARKFPSIHSVRKICLIVNVLLNLLYSNILLSPDEFFYISTKKINGLIMLG